MSQRSLWTIIAVVILLAILTVSYRITGDRGTAVTAAPSPPVSSEQTGSTTPAPAAPSSQVAPEPEQSAPRPVTDN